MSSYKRVDPLANYRYTEKRVDIAVKNGELSKPEARRILKEAEHNCRNQTVNKFLDRRGMLER
jgi:polyhydroxyalkanoate synthesis regulator phasin